MHLCGSRGSSPLFEGLTEYKTRKVALKYNLKTTGCGYPKEVKIVEELTKIFDSRFMDMYSFMPGKAWDYLGENFGDKAQRFLYDIENLMDDEFKSKYYDKMHEFDGVLGPIKKINAYNSLNYDEVYKAINNYKNELKQLEDRNKVLVHEQVNTYNNLKEKKFFVEDNFYDDYSSEIINNSKRR